MSAVYSPSRRLFAVVWFFAALACGPAAASEIKLKNGETYSGAAIVGRGPASIEVQLPHGRMTLLLSMVASIDGKRVPDPPDGSIIPMPRPAAVHSGASPVGTVTPARNGGSSTRPGLVSPPPLDRQAVAANVGWNWKWILLSILGFGAAWAGTVYLVRRDLKRSETSSRAWWWVTVSLPVAGYLLYQAWRQVRRKWERWQTEKQRHNFELLDADHHPVTIHLNEEISGIENAKEILQTALHQRASDVHIEPLPTECRVRFRIDGTLYPRVKLNPDSGIRLISALKSLAQIDITERRRAQDGRFAGRSGPRTVDFRLATTPSVHGEKLVIRILDRNAGLRGLKDIGLPENMMKEFTRAIHSRAGMILATGPTGSGKTSTLYAALSQLDAVQLNLVTIEDPVEYELAGATQIPVNNKVGVTFESGLRSILRQDPDVIFVGEMRDLEAAQIALRSALTGHLVFSSLHTRDAVGSIARLIEMGLDRPLLSSALFVVIGQRLVRVLCRACRQPYPCKGNELEELGFELPEGETIYRPAGCRKCESTGYIGRTAVFEMLIFDEELRGALNNNATEDAFIKLARTKGYRGYREDAAQKLLLGVTSVEEVLQAN